MIFRIHRTTPNGWGFHTMALTFFLLTLMSTVANAVDFKITCSPKLMTASVQLPSSKATAYLQRLKGYPFCQPRLVNGVAVFELSLENIYTCGTTRVYDRASGRQVFYHRIVVEHGISDSSKTETVLIKCDLLAGKFHTAVVPLDPPMHLLNKAAIERLRPKRNVLPANFTEAEDFGPEEITKVVVEVPAPLLNVMVKQNGRAVDTQVNVQPGTPLQMIVALDRNSSDTYGLLVKDIKVTDNTPTQEEIILRNGCSVDPYLFTNFETDDGKSVTARFRAFKFPESSYVLFIGTVNVCLQFCEGAQCSNGQVGYGRRRRELVQGSGAHLAKDRNKLFEVTMTTIMRVGFGEGEDPALKKDMVQAIQATSYEGQEMESRFESDNAVMLTDARGGASPLPFSTSVVLYSWILYLAAKHLLS